MDWRQERSGLDTGRSPTETCQWPLPVTACNCFISLSSRPSCCVDRRDRPWPAGPLRTPSQRGTDKPRPRPLFAKAGSQCLPAASRHSVAIAKIGTCVLEAWKAQEALVCSSGQHCGRSTSSVLRSYSPRFLHGVFARASASSRAASSWSFTSGGPTAGPGHGNGNGGNNRKS